MKSYCVIFVLSVLIPTTWCCATIQGEFNFSSIEEPNQYYYIRQSCVKIVELNPLNLQNLTYPIDFIDINKFTFDDLDTLNQPDLFASQGRLKFISFQAYYDPETIVLHENVFRGLVYLNEIVLTGLNIETIPKKLFSYSRSLEIVNLSHNKLRTIDSNTFANNNNLFLVYLTGNQILQSDLTLDLTFARNMTTIYLTESYVKDFGSLLPLFKNPNISAIRLDSSNLKNIKLSDFLQFPNRTKLVNIWTHDSDYAFYINDLNEYNIRPQIITRNKAMNKTDTLSAYIYNSVSENSNLCSDCQFLKETFKAHLRDGRLYIYLEAQNIVFDYTLDCRAVEKHYTSVFTSYCPAECSCRYNPFLDKIWFECDNKGLTRIPEIRYPAQLTSITSISIDLSKNNLDDINLSTVDPSVIELITELNLNDNQLKLIDFGDKILPRLHQIQLCQNPIWDHTKNLTMYIGDTWRKINEERCIVGVPLPINPLRYMSGKPDSILDAVLESGQCIAKT